MYTSISGSLWLCLQWHLSGNQESSLDMKLSAIPSSCALVHTTEQSWTMQTGLLLDEAEQENLFHEDTSCAATTMKHSGLGTRLELVQNSSPGTCSVNCQHNCFTQQICFYFVVLLASVVIDYLCHSYYLQSM